MRLTDADITILVEKFEQTLQEHRFGPTEVTFPYYPGQPEGHRKRYVRVTFDFDEMEHVH